MSIVKVTVDAVVVAWFRLKTTLGDGLLVTMLVFVPADTKALLAIFNKEVFPL